MNDGTAALSGRIHIGPDIDYLERAFDASKYGEFSREPYLDVTIPSILDPSVAPQGKHVMSIHVQFAPYRLRQGDWNEPARSARRHRRENACGIRARFARIDSRRPRHHARRSRRDLRPHGRASVPRRDVARSIFHCAAAARICATIAPQFAASISAARARIPATASPALPATTPRAKSSKICARLIAPLRAACCVSRSGFCFAHALLWSARRAPRKFSRG